MREPEYIERVVNSLRTVPEKQLLIIELANRIPINNGQLEPEELSSIQPEVNLAIQEAKMYGAHTIVAVSTLNNLEAAPEDV